MAKVNNEKWEAYKSSIPGLDSLLKPALTTPSDSDIEYNSLTEKLPSDVLAQMQGTKQGASEQVWGASIAHHWCLCDMQEGDFPRVHVYPNLQSLTEAIAKREGKETLAQDNQCNRLGDRLEFGFGLVLLLFRMGILCLTEHLLGCWF